MSRSALSLVPQPPPDRGRLLSADDVVGLFPRRPDGRPVVSRNWVMRHFCPSGKLKIGRYPAWWESDAVAWISSQQAGAA